MKLPQSIKKIQEGLLSKKFSAVDLVDSYLARIKKVNKEYNILLTITEDEAYRKAKAVDGILNDLGEKAISQFPLLGSTVIYKDLFLTKGTRTTAGAKVLDDFVPAYSATVVEKLDKAGAIMIGKANCDAWAHGASGENSDFGATKNPWNKEYVPGGSSSGSAAAIAADISTFALGTDTGGSIRLPANFCGVVGLKPTYGLVSRYGVIAMASSLDVVGNLTKTVEDSEIVFKVMKGEDRKDSNVMGDVKGKNFRDKKVLRIGIAKEYFPKDLDKEVRDILEKVKDIFSKNDFDLVDISLPHTKYAISTYYIIQPAEVSSNLSRFDGVRYGHGRDYFNEEAKRRIMLGTYCLSAGYYDRYYLKAQKVRSIIINDFNKVFGKVDLILAPVSSGSAFKLGEKASDPLKMYLSDILTVSANLAGIPSIAIPYGVGKNNLPLGFQLMGPKFSEPMLFEVGKRFQDIVNWMPKPALIK